jgi:type II secretory pathway pseudopilin PulG
MKKNHFTLTELLVVVGLIIILFSIGVPAVITGMRKGELTECKGNLRQLSQATTVFLKDNKNYFPGKTSANWIGSSSHPISAYLGSSYDNVNVCPSDPDGNNSYRASAKNSLTNDLNATGGSNGLRLSKVKRPNTMSLFVSKKVYDRLGNSINTQWHGSDNTYPFVNVGGSITSFVFTDDDLDDASTTRIDFWNE